MEFWHNKYTRALLLILLLQIVVFYAVAFRDETVPPVPPLVTFPQQLGPWSMVKNIPVEKEALNVLRADDTLSRVYFSAPRGASYLWIAYFKTQRYGQSPHSPKNCLPGAGWEPVEDARMTIRVPACSPLSRVTDVSEVGLSSTITVPRRTSIPDCPCAKT